MADVEKVVGCVAAAVGMAAATIVAVGTYALAPSPRAAIVGLVVGGTIAAASAWVLVRSLAPSGGVDDGVLLQPAVPEERYPGWGTGAPKAAQSRQDVGHDQPGPAGEGDGRFVAAPAGSPEAAIGEVGQAAPDGGAEPAAGGMAGHAESLGARRRPEQG